MGRNLPTTPGSFRSLAMSPARHRRLAGRREGRPAGAAADRAEAGWETYSSRAPNSERSIWKRLMKLK